MIDKSCVTILCVVVTCGVWVTSGQDLKWEHVDRWVKQVSVGPAGVWGVHGVHDEKRAYYRAGSRHHVAANGSTWDLVSDKSFDMVDVGKDIVFAIESKGDIYYRTGIEESNPIGVDWWQMYNDDDTISNQWNWITISPSGNLWGTNDGATYWRQGVSESRPEGTSWHRENPYKEDWSDSISLDIISAGAKGVWAINLARLIYYRNGTYGDKFGEKGTHFQQVGLGNLRLRFITSGSHVVGLDDDFVAWLRAGISKDMPMGREWLRLKQVKLFTLDSFNGTLWASGPQGQNYIAHPEDLLDP